MDRVFDEFASMYIAQFMETLVTGCSGGLYGNVIEPNDGLFELDDVRKFIKFQHGDNDYHYNFSRTDDQMLQDNPALVCRAFLEYVDTEWYSKDHYTEVCPNLIENVKKRISEYIGNEE